MDGSWTVQDAVSGGTESKYLRSRIVYGMYCTVSSPSQPPSSCETQNRAAECVFSIGTPPGS